MTVTVFILVLYRNNHYIYVVICADTPEQDMNVGTKRRFVQQYVRAGIAFIPATVQRTRRTSLLHNSSQGRVIGAAGVYVGASRSLLRTAAVHATFWIQYPIPAANSTTTAVLVQHYKQYQYCRCMTLMSIGRRGSFLFCCHHRAQATININITIGCYMGFSTAPDPAVSYDLPGTWYYVFLSHTS